MRKVLCLFVALLLCMSMVIPAYASETTFVPSISDKDGPDIVIGEDEEGNSFMGTIFDPNGNMTGHVTEGALTITSIAKVEVSENISEEARQQLLDIYEKLNNGTMVIPFDKVSGTLNPENLVIRDLIDVSWFNEEFKNQFTFEGGSIELSFVLGVNGDTNVYAMAYVNGEWVPVKKLLNNGDGTVTVTLESLGPVVFAVDKDATVTPPQTGDNANLTLWVVVMAVSVAAMAAVVIYRRKTAQKG